MANIGIKWRELLAGKVGMRLTEIKGGRVR